MNAPFLGPVQWDAEIAKMIKAFGAPVDPGDAKTIGIISRRITGDEHNAAIWLHQRVLILQASRGGARA
jgi:hypothetical protein